MPLVRHKAWLWRETDILLWCTLAKETDFIQLSAVNGKRHCFAETDVTKCSALGLILMGDVEGEDTDGDFRTKINGVITASLAVQQGRCRSKLQRLGLVVNLTIDDRQQATRVLEELAA